MKSISKGFSILILAVFGFFITSTAQASDEPFIASITILTPLSIVETTPLTFPTTEAATVNQTVVVAPGDAGAASFNISGQNNSAISASIVENNLTMTVGQTSIVVDSFTYGGGLAADGTAVIGNQGSVSGAAVGATANIPANPDSGNYSGTLTFRVVYQ